MLGKILGGAYSVSEGKLVVAGDRDDVVFAVAWKESFGYGIAFLVVRERCVVYGRASLLGREAERNKLGIRKTERRRSWEREACWFSWRGF